MEQRQHFENVKGTVDKFEIIRVTGINKIPKYTLGLSVSQEKLDALNLNLSDEDKLDSFAYSQAASDVMVSGAATIDEPMFGGYAGERDLFTIYASLGGVKYKIFGYTDAPCFKIHEEKTYFNTDARFYITGIDACSDGKDDSETILQYSKVVYPRNIKPSMVYRKDDCLATPENVLVSLHTLTENSKFDMASPGYNASLAAVTHDTDYLIPGQYIRKLLTAYYDSIREIMTDASMADANPLCDPSDIFLLTRSNLARRTPYSQLERMIRMNDSFAHQSYMDYADLTDILDGLEEKIEYVNGSVYTRATGLLNPESAASPMIVGMAISAIAHARKRDVENILIAISSPGTYVPCNIDTYRSTDIFPGYEIHIDDLAGHPWSDDGPGRALAADVFADRMNDVERNIGGLVKWVALEIHLSKGVIFHICRRDAGTTRYFFPTALLPHYTNLSVNDSTTLEYVAQDMRMVLDAAANTQQR